MLAVSEKMMRVVHFRHPFAFLFYLWPATIFDNRKEMSVPCFFVDIKKRFFFRIQWVPKKKKPRSLRLLELHQEKVDPCGRQDAKFTKRYIFILQDFAVKKKELSIMGNFFLIINCLPQVRQSSFQGKSHADFPFGSTDNAKFLFWAEWIRNKRYISDIVFHQPLDVFGRCHIRQMSHPIVFLFLLLFPF